MNQSMLMSRHGLTSLLDQYYPFTSIIQNTMTSKTQRPILIHSTENSKKNP